MPDLRRGSLARLTLTAGAAACAAILNVPAVRVLAGAQEMLPLQGDIAPVHDPAVIKEKNTYYLFFHAYFGEGRGRGSALQISTVAWNDGWPEVATLR